MIPLRDINPTRTFPFFTILIIVANAAVFLYELSLGRRLDAFINLYGTVPCEISSLCPLPRGLALPVFATIFTSMFMHGGWLHILGNMLYFWIFGNNIEDRFGHLKFLIIYLLWGVVAAFTQIFVDPASSVPAIGASGAIAGVLGAYLVMFPRAQVDSLLTIGIFLTTVRLPAIFVIGFWIVLQFFSGFLSLGVAHSQADSGGVAYFAHIGGALAGLVVGLLYRALNPQRTAVADSYGWR
jgi:membrane associated rhomboid family serine protease